MPGCYFLQYWEGSSLGKNPVQFTSVAPAIIWLGRTAKPLLRRSATLCVSLE